MSREIALPCRVAELVAIAEAHAPAALLPPPARRRLRSIVDPLPPVSSQAGLECRLGAGDDRVDLAICLQLDAAGRQRLAEALDAPAAREASARSPGWRRAAAFLQAWAEAGSVLHQTVSVVWLEFDASDEGRPPEPFLVFTLAPERFYASGTADPGALAAILAHGLELLSDGLDAATASGVAGALRALPRSAQLLHAAARPTEAGPVARLVVRMPWRALPDYLVSAGWPGSREELSSQLEELCAPTLVHAINLDVGPGIGPRVGIEFYPPNGPGGSARSRSFFGALESLGACSAERAGLVAAWPSGVASPPGRGAAIRVERELMVKVVHEPGAPLRAKAYLGFGPRLALA